MLIMLICKCATWNIQQKIESKHVVVYLKTKISNEVNTTNLRCILLLETRSGLVPMQIISGLVHKHLPPGEEKGHEPWNKQDSFS